MLKLIGGYLRSGVTINGVVIETEEGTLQGGPLSPLLSNIYLDPLDRELERRGDSFSRYADDCNIYVGSEPAAKRVMETITAWIVKKLRLTVNASKSGSGRPWERKFLGFCLTAEGAITASAKSLNRFKRRVREFCHARRSRTSEQRVVAKALGPLRPRPPYTRP